MQHTSLRKTDAIIRWLRRVSHYAMSPLVSLVILVCSEWLHRGKLTGQVWTDNILPHLPAYLFTWLLLACVYQSLATLTRRHWIATLVTGLLGYIPCIITYYKLKLRGEPLFPWDFSQIWEAADVAGQAGLSIYPAMIGAIAVLILLCVVTFFVKEPAIGWKTRLLTAVGTAGVGGLVVAVFVMSNLSTAIGIIPDMWLQDRYYRNYGVLAGFLTNIQNLKIEKPANYNKNTIQTLLDSQSQAPLVAGSYAEQIQQTAQQPNIIFVMNEAFWDVSELEEYGVEFDRELTPNLQRIKEQAAFGRLYSPSFGGGTCDVEFEALTGYSVEFLPSGSKPYQQHLTKPVFALPRFLLEQGYATQAVHCYYERFWSRNTAYPNLGFEDFVSLEDFENPERKRLADWSGGLVSDAEMARKIVELWQERDTDKPYFLHAVTMQNHTAYMPENYPDEERVKVLQAPDMSEKTLGALEDFATGVADADAMLGTLVDYFSQVDEPVILVFWGDHYNPIGNGTELYTATGYVEDGRTDQPKLHQMPLVIWSNYWDEPLELGTLAAYQLAPTVLQLYGMEQPAFYNYLLNQFQVYRSRTRGITILPDETASYELSQEQNTWFEQHRLLQYDLMFGNGYASQE